MSSPHGEGLLPTPELPSQDQLLEFSNLVTGVIAKSRNIITFPDEQDDKESPYVITEFDLSSDTWVLVGRNNALLYAPNTIDITLSNMSKGAWSTDTAIKNTYRAAYSLSTGETGYSSEKQTFVNGRVVRSQQELESLALIENSSFDEYIRLVHLTQEELLSEDSELARMIWNQSAGYSQEDVLDSLLTRDRLEIMLEILRYIKQHPELERLSSKDIAKMAPALLEDIAKDLPNDQT